MLELHRTKPLGENIRLLLGGPNVLGNNSLRLADLSTEEMVLKGEVFVACGHLGNIDQRQTTLVVFKYSGADQAVGNEFHVQLGSEFLEQGAHGEQLPHGHTESNILRSSAAESNFSLEFAGPNNGAASQRG